MLECFLTCVYAAGMCLCMSEQEKCTGSTGGGGVGAGWLWRISQGLKAGIQAERRGGGGLFTRGLGLGRGRGVILQAFTSDRALNTGSQMQPQLNPLKTTIIHPPLHTPTQTHTNARTHPTPYPLSRLQLLPL